MVGRRSFFALALAGCALADETLRAPRATPRRARPRAAGSSAAPEQAARRDDEPVVPALLLAHPRLSAIPRVELTSGPTPIERAAALEAQLGLELLLIKRDDLANPAYGGGKIRKLETLLAEAERLRAKRLVTFGSVGSHHALATAVHGRARGLDVELLLLPEPPSAHVRETLRRTLLSGARASLAPSMKSALGRATELVREGDTFVIPVGGTSPLANVGFVAAGFELAAQLVSSGAEPPERVYIPLGTNGSAAGLALGLRAAGLDCRVVGVRASSPSTSSEAKVRDAIASTAELLRSYDETFPEVEPRVEIDGAELGPGYALPTARAKRASDRASNAGLALETTYTAKAFAALCRDAEHRKVKRALFWLTHDARPGPAGDPPSVPRELAGWLRREGV
jgi:1-aminocyclopropane-1-carboxylate deaminase/D-cysteine desulfhydrase-like pyridoxal-dependent ACC family enzyme